MICAHLHHHPSNTGIPPVCSLPRYPPTREGKVVFVPPTQCTRVHAPGAARRLVAAMSWATAGSGR